MLLNIITKRMTLSAKMTMKFSGGHHHHVYDWRDDHTKNPDLFDDPRTVNIQPAEEYTFPYSAKPQTWILSHPENYNPKDLSTNMTGTPIAGMYNYPDVSHKLIHSLLSQIISEIVPMSMITSLKILISNHNRLDINISESKDLFG